MVGQLNACEMVGRHDGKGVVGVLLLAMKLGGGAGALSLTMPLATFLNVFTRNCGMWLKTGAPHTIDK